MALIDDINALPTTVGDGQTGHLQNHAIIHAALKDHETRLGARDMVGTGSPAGRISATIGTTYTDTAATNGATRWIKTSGTGTTGWSVEYGDTGWRNLTTEMSDIVESGVLRLRRVGGIVHVEASWLKLKGEGLTDVYFPQGFTPSGNMAVPLYSSSGLSTPVAIIRISFNGRVTVYVTDDRYSGNDMGIMYTDDPWPTILPGTPG